jgi:hypothetical protein
MDFEKLILEKSKLNASNAVKEYIIPQSVVMPSCDQTITKQMKQDGLKYLLNNFTDVKLNDIIVFEYVVMIDRYGMMGHMGARGFVGARGCRGPRGSTGCSGYYNSEILRKPFVGTYEMYKKFLKFETRKIQKHI